MTGEDITSLFISVLGLVFITMSLIDSWEDLKYRVDRNSEGFYIGLFLFVAGFAYFIMV